MDCIISREKEYSTTIFITFKNNQPKLQVKWMPQEPNLIYDESFVRNPMKGKFTIWDIFKFFFLTAVSQWKTAFVTVRDGFPFKCEVKIKLQSLITPFLNPIPTQFIVFTFARVSFGFTSSTKRLRINQSCTKPTSTTTFNW